MLVDPELLPVRIAILVGVAVIATATGLVISRRTGWALAGPLALIAATPLVPSLPVVAGISTDDILPGVGIVLGMLGLRHRRAPWPRLPRLLVLGAGLMALAGLVSSLANATGPASALAMGLKSVGHMVLLALVALVALGALPADRRHAFVARAIAMVATFEAAFGIVSWVLPLPWMAGLEPTRQMTSLGGVPGRIAGTTGLSPNFLGAVFVLSVPITAALALDATTPARRLAWWAAVVAQVLALALTFTRTSLVIVVAILAVMLLIRGHARILAGIGVLVFIVALVTPLGARIVGDANDRAALWSSAAMMMLDHPLAGVGPGRMLEVAREQPDRYRDTPFGEAVSNAHNTVLLAGAETGVLGAIGALLVNLSLAASALATVLVTTIGTLRARRIRGPTSGLVLAAALGGLGFLVQGMTNNLFVVRVTSVMAILVLATFIVPAPATFQQAIRSAVGRPGSPSERGAPDR